jgi:hypothetical protein
MVPGILKAFMEQLKSSEKIVQLINGNTYAIAGNSLAIGHGIKTPAPVLSKGLADQG